MQNLMHVTPGTRCITIDLSLNREALKVLSAPIGDTGGGEFTYR